LCVRAFTTRARACVDEPYPLFAQPHATMARLAELPQLQLLAEASELLALLDTPLLVEHSHGSWSVSERVGTLFSTWAARFPSESQHDAAVWDDLISSRRLFFGIYVYMYIYIYICIYIYIYI